MGLFSKRNPPVRKSVMQPLLNRLSGDAQFRNLILSILTTALHKSVYELPVVSLDVILRDLLPVEVNRLQLNYDEIQAFCLAARVMRVSAKETDTVYVHPIELLHSPESYEHWLEKGKILCGMGMLWNSIRCFDQAIAMNPSCAETYYRKANSLFQLGKVTTEIDQLDCPRSINPIWAQLKYVTGIFLEATEVVDRAIQTNPKYTDAMYLKGACLIEIGRPANDVDKVQEALVCFRQILSIDSSHVNAKTALKM